jgi:hypothetical protein
MMTVMSTPNRLKVNEAVDEEILSHEGVSDHWGTLLYIHETLFHSKTEGFYLKRTIPQRFCGRTWETIDQGEVHLPENAASDEKVRILTVYRRMDRYQVMRFIVDSYMPTEEGIREETIRILNGESRSQEEIS